MTTSDITMTTTEQTAPAVEQSSQAGDGFFSIVREALRGARHDYTALPLKRAILLLAIPMVAEMLWESLFAVADIFWVSKLGPDAAASVILTESMMIIVYSFAMGLSIGGAALVAHRIGEKDPDGAARSAVQAILLGITLTVVVSLVGGLAGHKLLAAMGASPQVVATGSGFTWVMVGGC